MVQAKGKPAIEYLLIILTFCVCLTGALLLPANQCPDEAARMLLTRWIAQTGTLPKGNELQILILPENVALLNEVYPPVTREMGAWGFSYALRPYLSAMVGGLFQKTASCFTDSPRILLAASRMCSVLSVTFCCFFCLRLGHRLFDKQDAAVLFAVLVCFLPQVQFLGMYQNNDSLSLCAVCMMLYYLIEGFDLGWPIRSCVGLAVGFSLGLLSYYTIYGWLLMSAAFYVLAVFTDPEFPDKGRLVFSRAGLILGICVLLTGWFFIRNACLHNGDFLGIASEEASRAEMRSRGYKLYDYVRYRDAGMSIPDFLRMGDHWWLRLSAWSFVGVFGYMDILLPRTQYRLYGAVIAGGALLYTATLFRHKPSRRDGLLSLTMLLASLITVLLHFWQSYTRDFQPQGRYIITLALSFGYVLVYGIDGLPECANAHLHPAAVLTAGWLALFAWAALGTMSIML